MNDTSRIEPDRWRRIDHLFDQALDLPSSARAEFLDRETGDDHELRAQVEVLLAAERDAGSFMERPIRPVTPAAGTGDLVGPWRLIRVLGRGGMGTVYLAERADGQFEQQVALKVVKPGMDSSEILQRFLGERQILARLEHPGIARLIDGGTTPGGQPWFALEYVPGESITGYAEQRRLRLDSRLELFDHVCEAVQHAHQNLVVHRDLKPSNVLVTPDGRVKLLDFGIAKVLHGSMAEGDTLTHQGQWVLTPEYGAPEQVRGEGITTATDVYALGAVLYELLTGRRAQRVEHHTPLEVIRVVCETEPPRPSDAAPERRRELAGDLDTIVGKALAKEPGRRYPTVAALREDLHRYRAGRPVLARPDSVGYLVRKFVRRHRLGVGIATATLVALTAGITATIWQANVARRESSKAREMKDVLLRLFEVTMTVRPGQSVIYPRELLDQVGRRLDSVVSMEPAMGQELLGSLGRIHFELGYLTEADSLLGRAEAAARRAYGPNHSEVRARLLERSRVRSARGDYRQAAQSLMQSLVSWRARDGSPPPVALVGELATGLIYMGELRSAETVLRNALAAFPAAGADPRARSLLLGRYGTVLEAGRRFRAADSVWSEGLALARGHLSSSDPVWLELMAAVAAGRERAGDLDSAIVLRRMLVAARRSFEPEAPATGEDLNALGLVLAQRGRLAEAESLLLEALTLERRLFGAEHPAALRSASNLALIRFHSGKTDRAMTEAAETLDLARQMLGPTDYTTCTLEHNLGGFLLEAGRIREAEPLLAHALTCRRAAAGDSSLEAGQSLRLTGLLRLRLGRSREAESALQQAAAIYQARLRPQDPGMADLQTALGQLYRRQGRMVEAREALESALAIRRATAGPDDPRTRELLRLFEN